MPPSSSPALFVCIHRVLRADPGRVFRAWTVPSELKRWFAAGEGYATPIAEVDLRIGGRFRIGMQAPNNGELSVATGVYEEIVPPARLVFTWHWEHDRPETPLTRLRLEFRPHPEGTELVMIHEGFADTSTQEQHSAGWQACLDSLERLINRS
jgi:uncharacterized protein YndB with AHSA1/START domain